MKKRELLERIERLEQRVRDLESRPNYYPAPILPVAPTPWPPVPYPSFPTIWCQTETLS